MKLFKREKKEKQRKKKKIKKEASGKKIRIIVPIIFIVLLVFIYIYSIPFFKGTTNYVKINNNLNTSLKTTKAQLNQANERLKSAIIIHDKNKKQIKNLEKWISNKKWSNKKDAKEFIYEIFKKLDIKVKQKKEVTRNSKLSVEYQYLIEGSFKNIISCFFILDNSPKIMSINNFSISIVKSKVDINYVQVAFTIRIYLKKVRRVNAN